MKKYFFDCGTHMFQGFQDFARTYNIDSSWECYCFEANPLTFEESKQVYNDLKLKYNINHINNAISNENGKVNMKCSKVKSWGHQVEIGTFTDQASNILKDPQKWWNGEFEEHEVQSLDFSLFLKQIVTKEDYVLIKMDIEGSEFDVLDKMFKDSTIELIDDIYVEFHERHFDDEEFYRKKKEGYFKTCLKNKINLFEWI